MAPSLDVEAICDSVLETVLPMVNDPIPNIRFNVAKSFEVLAKVLNQSPEGKQVIQSKIIPGLEKLKEDQDADVRFFAQKAFETEAIMMTA
jgi:serine/threonine-protein phosphatase 2A regulatory subunit A